MSVPTMPGVRAETVATERLTTRVLFTGAADAAPVLFLHGNLSSATWWEETMLALPGEYRGIALDLRGFGDADPAARVDATRGMGDYADDIVALLDHLGVDGCHVAGMSLGGSVIWHLMADHADRLLTVTLSAPGSPYGFCGTKGLDGEPTTADYAGSGGGLVNQLLVDQLEAKNAGTDSPFSLRNALRLLVWKPPVIPDREDDLVAASLETHVGADAYPGDKEESPNWPYFAPGTRGSSNALSPKYARDPEEILSAQGKPPVLWVRGDGDMAVGDTAAGDPATQGAMGLIPDYPGPDVFPAQPMVGQTRRFLERYEAAGGWFEELVVADCGHVPSITHPADFNRAFHAHLARKKETVRGGDE